MFPAEIWCHICSFLTVKDVWDHSWLYPFLQLNLDEDVKYIFQDACAEGKISFLEWLIQQERPNGVEVSIAFTRIAKTGGPIDVVNWIVATFGTPCPYAIFEFFLSAAVSGQIPMMEWAFSTFKLDVPKYINIYLHIVTHNGHLHVLQWFHKISPLTREQLQQDNNLLLKTANMDILQWFEDEFYLVMTK